MFEGVRAVYSKVINLLFGKTQIFVVIVGWFLVVTGALMLLRPEWARSKMKRQGVAVIKGYLLLALFFVVSVVFSLAGKSGRAWVWTLAIAAAVFLVWMFIAAMKKIKARMSALAASATVQALRYYALVQIVIGAVMLLLRKRFLV